MTKRIEFDGERARTYRKRAEVLAFRSEDPIEFHKSWGRQQVRGGSWVIVPLDDDGNPSQDVYGCDGEVFEATYEPVPSLRPNRFRKTETVQAYQPGQEFSVDTVLADGHVEVPAASAGSYDTWIVRAPGGELYPVADEVFRATYVEVQEPAASYRVRTRDEHWAADGTPKRILALDGGGVRGILTLAFLQRIETVLRKRHGDQDGFRLSHYFDLIAGTSTGAIIAACLARGMRVSEVVELYRSLTSKVFRRSRLRWGILRAKYSHLGLASILDDVFRGNTIGSAAIQTGLLVVAKRMETGSTWPISNNPFSRYYTAGPGDDFFSNEDYPLSKVVRASTAAPMYFAPESIEIASGGEAPGGQWVDGGVSPHNNPSLLALQLVSLSGFGVSWPLEVDKLMLVSVGTGSARPGVARGRFAARHAIRCLLSLMDDCSDSVETLLQWMSDSPTARPVDLQMGHLGRDALAERPLLHYLRYDVQFDAEWLRGELGVELSEAALRRLGALDRPGNLAELHDLGERAARRIEEAHFPERFDIPR